MLGNIFTLIVQIWATCALISCLFMWDVMSQVDDDFLATMILHILLPYVVIWKYRKSMFSKIRKVTKVLIKGFKNITNTIRKLG